MLCNKDKTVYLEFAVFPSKARVQQIVVYQGEGFAFQLLAWGLGHAFYVVEEFIDEGLLDQGEANFLLARNRIENELSQRDFLHEHLIIDLIRFGIETMLVVFLSFLRWPRLLPAVVAFRLGLCIIEQADLDQIEDI